MTAPRVWRLTGDGSDQDAVVEASRIVRAGGLVGFPTETVYGLAAAAEDPEAIARLNAVKGRPPEKPYSIHLYAAEQVRSFVASVPPAAGRLIQRFWPGPLTIVLPARDGRTIGFRLPDHPVARAFLSACEVPVVAPRLRPGGNPVALHVRAPVPPLAWRVVCG